MTSLELSGPASRQHLPAEVHLSIRRYDDYWDIPCFYGLGRNGIEMKVRTAEFEAIQRKYDCLAAEVS